MATFTCTYCGAEITMQSVESEDGHCPECGAIITLGRSNFGDEEEGPDETIGGFNDDEDDGEDDGEDPFDEDDEDSR